MDRGSKWNNWAIQNPIIIGTVCGFRFYFSGFVVCFSFLFLLFEILLLLLMLLSFISLALIVSFFCSSFKHLQWSLRLDSEWERFFLLAEWKRWRTEKKKQIEFNLTVDRTKFFFSSVVDNFSCLQNNTTFSLFLL